MMRREWKERKTECSNSENPSVRPEFKSARLERNPLHHSIHAFQSTATKINTYRNKAALYFYSINCISNFIKTKCVHNLNSNGRNT